MKINKYHSELTDVSAKKPPLVEYTCVPAIVRRKHDGARCELFYSHFIAVLPVGAVDISASVFKIKSNTF